MNELSQQTSPYLLQHANNPVHWKPWNDKTLADALEQNQLIIVSIGYSACHWCHVMEHESFENEDVAVVMNANFTCIKIDREEHPDVDAIYMKAVQLMSGRGGWPLNVVCLPDGRPIWGGTYLPKKNWTQTLSQLADIYENDRPKVVEYAEQLHDGISTMALLQPSENGFDNDDLEKLIGGWQSRFDKENGGNIGAPKFMLPVAQSFLMHYATAKNSGSILDHVHLTLEKMAFGGLFDQIGGGFSRYSVDERWHVAHFEKMLYDNAQLVSLYSNAFKLSQITLHKTVVEQTLEFVSKSLTSNENAFYCALDADSLNGEGKLEEGAFYVWTEAELREILKDDFQLFAKVFNINKFGHWEHGNFVLIRNSSDANLAIAENISIDELENKISTWRQMLYDNREKRPQPRLDNKILTSWNALMITAYAAAFDAFGNNQYLEKAIACAKYLLDKHYINGKLMHSKVNDGFIAGLHDDYALMIEALLALYQSTLDENWLYEAKKLTDICLYDFYDETTGFFAFKSKAEKQLIAPHYEIEDNVIPASNSVMAKNLYALSIYFGQSRFREIVDTMLENILPSVSYPSAFANWLDLHMTIDSGLEIAITGPNAFANAKKINARYFPGLIVAASENASTLPFLKDRFSDKDQFFVCENGACQLPIDSFGGAIEKLYRGNFPKGQNIL